MAATPADCVGQHFTCMDCGSTFTERGGIVESEKCAMGRLQYELIGRQDFK